MRVLVTSGGTREPIDSVRSITNASTGSTGAAIADAFTRAGHEVCYLHSPGAVRPQLPCERMTFDTFQDLARLLEGTVRGFDPDLVVHAAAVSDFRVERAPNGGKIESDGELSLRLQPNPKLIERIREWSPRGGELRLVGFKLVDGLTRDAALAKARSTRLNSGADLVVLNHKATFAWGNDHAFEFVGAQEGSSSFNGREALARGLLDWTVQP